jgi:hypothetical protein
MTSTFNQVRILKGDKPEVNELCLIIAEPSLLAICTQVQYKAVNIHVQNMPEDLMELLMRCYPEWIWETQLPSHLVEKEAITVLLQGSAPFLESLMAAVVSQRCLAILEGISKFHPPLLWHEQHFSLADYGGALYGC